MTDRAAAAAAIGRPNTSHADRFDYHRRVAHEYALAFEVEMTRSHQDDDHGRLELHLLADAAKTHAAVADLYRQEATR